MRERIFEIDDVPSDRIVDASRLSDKFHRGAKLIELLGVENRFDLLLLRIGKFKTVSIEDLYAVVLVGVMACGDHDPCIRAHTPSDKSDSRCGKRADKKYLRTHRTKAGCQGIFEHIARKARILSNHHLSG